jgi:CheY-like chemotaxis protein
MDPLILVVEDNPAVLKYIVLTLEHNNCKVFTANNGEEALKVLMEQPTIPDLIISDIMMPVMDGYEFFNAVSANLNLSHIPFIFLSALDSPENIRLGKMLGVDDYLTKPINEDDLLATIAGKVKRSKKIEIVSEKFNEIYALYKAENKILPESADDDAVLIEVNWDDIYGPKLVDYYPKETGFNYPLEKIGDQLYDVISSIYGQGRITHSEGLLIPVKNYDLMSYIFFDSYKDDSFRGGFKDYMFSVIAPKISYFHSLHLKKVFIELSSLYKDQKPWDIAEFWNEITRLLNTPLMSTV